MREVRPLKILETFRSDYDYEYEIWPRGDWLINVVKLNVQIVNNPTTSTKYDTIW